MCSHLYWWHLRVGQKAKIQTLQKEADKLVRVATNIYIFWAKAEAGWIEERLIGVVTKRRLIHAPASSPRLLLSPCHLSPNREFLTCICLIVFLWFSVSVTNCMPSLRQAISEDTQCSGGKNLKSSCSRFWLRPCHLLSNIFTYNRTHSQGRFILLLLTEDFKKVISIYGLYNCGPRKGLMPGIYSGAAGVL